MVELIIVTHVPRAITTERLSRDIGKALQNHNGVKIMSTQVETSLQEIYEVPKEGAVWVNSDNTRYLEIKRDGVRNPDDKVSSILMTMGFKSESFYSKLTDSLRKLVDDYQSEIGTSQLPRTPFG